MSKKILVALFTFLVLPAAAMCADLGKARMSLVQGDVQILSEEAGDWIPAAINMPLQEGDQLWVPEDGRSELQLQGGTLVRLDSMTAFDIISLATDTSQFYLSEGRAWLNNSRTGIKHIQIDTPISSVSCYDNALVMVDVTESGATDISVLQGYVYAETKNGKIRVTAGSTLSIGEDLSAELYPLDATDDWAEWNKDLDRRLAETGVSYRYLPGELHSYGYDLDSHGRWLYDTSYGYVWTPTLFISVNWAPYRIGRWIWIGGQYVWISYEPWGWAPYHYGRWIHRPHVGWCWVPPRRGSVYWAPGYVGWVYTPTYVAWVPLAPTDIYYGHGYYGPGSVNINTIVASRHIFNRNYVNINIRDAVTTLHRDTFLHGGKSAVPLPDNPFRQKNVGIGPPRFAPEKSSYAPALKTIPRDKLPPQRIRQISPQPLRKERPIVPDRRGSAFSPGLPAKEMPFVIREAPAQPTRKQPEIIFEEPRRTGKERSIPSSPIIQAPQKTGETRGRETLRMPGPVQERKPAMQKDIKPPEKQTPAIRKQVVPKAPSPPSGAPPTTMPAARKPGASTRQKSSQSVTIPTAPQPVAPQPVAPQPVAPQPTAPVRVFKKTAPAAPTPRTYPKQAPGSIGPTDRQAPARFGAQPAPSPPAAPSRPAKPSAQQQIKPASPPPASQPVEQPPAEKRNVPRRSGDAESQKKTLPDRGHTAPPSGEAGRRADQ